MRVLLFLSLLLLLAPLQAAPQADIDPRLAPLGVTIEAAQDCSLGCWRIVSAQFEDEQESAGLHHAWAKMLDADDNELGGQPWRLAWPGGEQQLVTKAPPEWADFPIFDCYFPDTERGAYSAYAGDDPTRSDIVSGMGLPACHHVSFRMIWQWQSSATPTPTPEPVPALPFHWYMPLAVE